MILIQFWILTSERLEDCLANDKNFKGLMDVSNAEMISKCSETFLYKLPLAWNQIDIIRQIRLFSVEILKVDLKGEVFPDANS